LPPSGSRRPPERGAEHGPVVPWPSTPASIGP
jgi:hypothetical protein